MATRRGRETKDTAQGGVGLKGSMLCPGQTRCEVMGQSGIGFIDIERDGKTEDGDSGQM